jgi:glutathione S-transferase
MTLELYTYEACPYAQRSRIALAEKGVEHRLVEVDLSDRPDWWAAVSPTGKVPLLVDGETRIWESAVINQYLDERYPEPPLMPRDPGERARARIWIDYCDSTLMAACHRLIRDRRDKARQSENRDAVADAFRFIERHAFPAGWRGPYWLGADFSLVDIHYAPFIERFPCYERLWGAELPGDCTRFAEWFAAVAARPSFAATRHDLAYHLPRYERFDTA